MPQKIPPHILLALLAAALALTAFVLATDAFAYAGHAAATCNNCHVMDDAYESWVHGGHQEWAVCADCHTPHAFIPKYYVKARQGLHDIYVFVFRGAPQTQLIHAGPESLAIVQENCLRCHSQTVETVMLGVQPFERNCWDCHRQTGHGGFGASPFPYQDSRIYP